MSDTKLREKADALIAFTQQGPRFIAWVQAVTDTLAPAPEKAAKVCGNCGEKVSSLSDHVTCAETGDYYCKPAPPAPEKAAKVSAFPVGNCVVCGELVAPYNKHAKYEGGHTCQRPQPAPPERAKVECPNCGEMTEHNHSRYEGPGPDKWACQPAPPELSKVCPNCQKPEEEPHFAGNLTGDGGWYFCPGRVPKAVEDHQRPQSAQPVAVGMTEELEHVLSIAERDLRYKEECFDNSARTVHDERIERLRAAIATVREQFGKRPKLEKVRGALSWLKMQYEPGSQGYTPNATVWKMTEAALAELDAAEKGEGRG